MEDLTPGMKLPGIVTNLTAFGAFVDIGVHQDGLVHLSQFADRFVKNPGDVLKVRQTVEVTVLAVDLEQKRISLTLKKQPGKAENPNEKMDAKPAAKGRRRAPGPARAPGDSSQARQGHGKSPQEKATPGKPPEERPGEGHPRRERPGHGRPQHGKPRDEKVPFNNPFATVFGKK